MNEARSSRPQRVGIIGQGTAGLLAALALKEHDPTLSVTLVSSSGIPVIGVGEATTPILPPFLFGYLGIDPHRFEREVGPTFKLGIRFEWGKEAPWYFNYAFGDGDLTDAQRHDGHTLNYSSTSQLMSADKAPLVKIGDKVIPLLKETRFAYHLDNVRLVRFLETRAREVGIETVDATVHEVIVQRTSEGGVVRHLETSAGPLAFDLYVDCTGFRSLIMGAALHVPFENYGSSLFTDRAVTAVRKGGPGRVIKPYTTARSLSAGWAWTIPMRDEDHHGYVFSSRFITEEQARAELEAAYPGCEDFKVVRFRSGRLRDFVHGNVVALGNSYGFVEPLESTAIHMAIVGISRLLELMATPTRHASMPVGPHGSPRLSLAVDRGDSNQETPRPIASAALTAGLNAQMAAHWDWLRWFLAVHYRFNRRMDTPFWREVHLTTDWSGLEASHRDFVANGPFSGRESPPKFVGDIVFGPRGLDILLMGQGVVPERLDAKTTTAEWRELVGMRQRLVTLALPQEEAFGIIASERKILDDLVHDEASWCKQMANEMTAFAPPAGRSQDALGRWATLHHVPHMLGHEMGKVADEFPANPTIDFGKFIRRVPSIVLRPKDQHQLAECIEMLVSRQIPMKVRGAGHSSGGQTLIDEGAVLDLRWLKRIIADDVEHQRVRVEGGLWWLELCGHLRKTGRRPLVLTDNWRSTVGGTLAVGGFGDASHREGLQIAGVRELMVMTLDGTRHRVKAGDPLFDWSLAGRGQLGIITEVALETVTKSTDLEARVLGWRDLTTFVADMKRVVGQRFDWLRARLQWREGAPVAAAAGHMLPVDGMALDDFKGLLASMSAPERLDLFEKSAEPPDERWQLASPSVEVVLPVNESGMAALLEIHRRVSSSQLARYLTQGSSLMALSGREVQRFPMAPLPDCDLCVMLAIRPEVPRGEVEPFLPLLEWVAEHTLDAGGKVYAMSIEPRRERWLETQLGAGRYADLLKLKTKHDPLGLLNPGFIGV